MIFTTYTYALFLVVVFCLHWVSPRAVRPWILIFASYFFYGTWRWPYVGLLLAVTLFNWGYARIVLAAGRGGPLWPGVTVNLLVLIGFKYLDFILQNVGNIVQFAGWDFQPAPLGILLPLGISFFTFQGIAYLVDVASGEPPMTRLRDFMLYKAFWPQLIAGPIIRPDEIRGQIEAPSPLSWDDFSEGIRRILQGAFKKIVLADTLAQHVDLAFLGKSDPHALDTLAGTLGFGLQIYFDFSAYSDFAIGSARLFGYRFPENFDWPYLSRSPQEFWGRWHMSLSRWIRDYVFTPLSFAARRRPAMIGIWLVVSMALCGLWHGAQWTFVIWGAWHGVFLALQQSWLRPLFTPGTAAKSAFSWALTMLVVFAGWLFFRAPSLDSVFAHLHALATLRGGLRPALIRENGVLAIGLIALLMLIATLVRGQLAPYQSLQEKLMRGWRVVRPAVYAGLLAAVVVLDQEAKAFVYFQF